MTDDQKARQREASRRYYAKNRERVKARNRAYKAANAESERATNAAYREANRDACRERVKAHREANPAYYASQRAKRRAQQLTATYGDPVAIDYVYHAAQVIADVYGGKPHVDHIVPLQGAAVSGLHAPQNLQLLSPSDNIRKSNR